MVLYLYLILAALLGYWLLKTFFVRRLQRTGRAGNTTLIVFSFVAGLALGSGNFLPTVWIPLLLAFVVYHWPRLKAMFIEVTRS